MIDAEFEFGAATALVPPVVLGGVEYSLAVRLYPSPTNTTGEMFGSWIVERALHLGGTRYRIVLRRDWQVSSYVIPPQAAGQGSTEVQTRHWMGGNGCNSPEWWRVYNRNNAMAMRGSLEASRFVPGDTAFLVQGSKRFAGEVRVARAYGFAPEEVNFAGGENQELPSYIDVEVSPLRVETRTDGDANARYYPGAQVLFNPSAAFPYNVTGVFAVDGDTATECERVIFQSGGVADERLLPPDFGAGLTGTKYWWDTQALEARLSQGVLAAGDTGVLIWILSGVVVADDLPSANQVIVEHLGGAVGGVSDAVGLSAWLAEEEFDYSVVLFGPGIVWWRASTAAGAACVSIQVDGAGDITVRRRNSLNTAAVVEHAGGEGLSFPMDVRIERDSAGEITVSRRQDAGVSWTVVEALTLSGVDAVATGVLGVSALAGSGGTRYLVLAPTTALTRTYYSTGAAGLQSVVRVSSVDLLPTRDFPLRAGTIAEVWNLTSDSAMTDGSAARRDRYEIVDGALRLNLESDGDRVRVTFVPAAAPDPPGMAPVTPDLPGFATFADPLTEARLATTDVAENRGNWSDYVEVDFGVGVSIEAGDVLEGWRGFAALHAIDEVTYNDQAGSGEEWLAVDAADYRAVLPANLILFRKSWLDGLDVFGDMCVRVLARRYRSGFFAHAVNELRDAVNGLSDLWAEAFTGYGDGRGMHGTFQRNLGHTEILVLDAAGLWTLWPAGFAYGISWNGVTNFWLPDPNPPDFLAGSVPYWTGVEYNDLKLRSSPRTASVVEAPAPNVDTGLGTGRSDGLETIVGEGVFQVNPFAFESGALKDYVGAEFFISQAPGPIASQYAAFSIRAIPVAIPDIVTRLNDLGGTIEEALIRVRVSGLEYQQWTWEGEVDNQNNGWVKKHINGKLVEDTSDTPGTPDYDPQTDEFVAAGVLTFMLIGIRRDSSLIVDVFGNTVLHPNIDLVGGGVALGGGGTVVESGEWVVVDFTGGMRFLLAMLDSDVAYDGFYLVPSVGSPTLDAAPGSLANYLETLCNEIEELTFTEDFPSSWSVYGRSRGRIAYWDSIETGVAMFRFSLGGVSERLVLPHVTPPAMGGVEE